jgi:hypothetical protein
MTLDFIVGEIDKLKDEVSELKKQVAELSKHRSVKKPVRGTELERAVFDIGRSAYPGIKRGNDTEFNNFVKQHQDWKEALPRIGIAVQNQIKSRMSLSQTGAFIPHWKNFQTWINQRSWEEEVPLPPVEPEKKPAIPASDYFFNT